MARRRGPSQVASLAVVMILLFLLVIGGLWVYDKYIKGATPTLPGAVAPPAQQPVYPPAQQPQAYPGKLTGQAVDRWTGAGIASPVVDIIDPAVMSSPKETVISTDTNGLWTSSGAVFYSPGERYKLHVRASGYYDEVVDIIVPSNPAFVANEYRYSVGQIRLTQRVAANEITFRLLDPTGGTLSSATGSTPGSQGVYTATAKMFNLKVSISLSVYRKSWGKDLVYLKPTTYEQTTLKPVIWIAVNNTAVSHTALINAGWEPVTTTAFTGWVAFYKVLPEVASTDSTLGTYTVDIPIDTSALPAGRNVLIYVWIADLQDPANAKSFIPMTSLVAFGAFSGYGVTSPIGLTPTVVGGAPASPLLQARIVTA